MGQLERQSRMQALQSTFNTLAMEHRAEIIQMRKDRNQKGLSDLQDQLEAEANAIVAEKGLGTISEEMKQVYSTIGGTPFLDGQYTVFGEVEEGLDIVGRIQEVATDSNDRPLEDLKMTVTIL